MFCVVKSLVAIFSCHFLPLSANVLNDTILFLIRGLLVTATVLLPVLGVTWIIGIMAVNDNNNEVFRWIFAVSNCLQVNSITQQYSVWLYVINVLI